MRDGFLTIVLFLALVGCERSNINSVGDSEALFEAIKAKDVATVKSIVESRTVDLDPPRLPNQNNKALVYASAYGNLEIVEIILKEGVDINGQGAYGDVAMIKAAEHGNQDIIDHLISSGADVNQPNVFGVTPFIGFCPLFVSLLLPPKFAFTVGLGLNNWIFVLFPSMPFDC